MKINIILYSLVLILGFNQKKCFQDDPWYYPLKSNNLKAFEQLNGSASYEIQDRMLIGTSTLNSPNSFLALKEKYADFILEFEVKIDLDLNSGVQIRSHCDPNIKDGRVHGYQVEIETSDRRWAGGIYEESGRGWLYPLTEHAMSREAWNNEQWNHYRIEAIGDTLKTWVNGTACAYLIDDLSSEGIIAFQVHSISDERLEGKKVYWKNIRILDSDVEKHRIKIDAQIHQVDLTLK